MLLKEIEEKNKVKEQLANLKGWAVDRAIETLKLGLHDTQRLTPEDVIEAAEEYIMYTHVELIPETDSDEYKEQAAFVKKRAAELDKQDAERAEV